MCDGVWEMFSLRSRLGALIRDQISTISTSNLLRKRFAVAPYVIALVRSWSLEKVYFDYQASTVSSPIPSCHSKTYHSPPFPSKSSSASIAATAISPLSPCESRQCPANNLTNSSIPCTRKASFQAILILFKPRNSYMCAMCGASRRDLNIPDRGYPFPHHVSMFTTSSLTERLVSEAHSASRPYKLE